MYDMTRKIYRCGAVFTKISTTYFFQLIKNLIIQQRKPWWNGVSMCGFEWNESMKMLKNYRNTSSLYLSKQNEEQNLRTTSNQNNKEIPHFCAFIMFALSPIHIFNIERLMNKMGRILLYTHTKKEHKN